MKECIKNKENIYPYDVKFNNFICNNNNMFYIYLYKQKYNEIISN